MFDHSLTLAHQHADELRDATKRNRSRRKPTTQRRVSVHRFPSSTQTHN